MSFEYLSTAPLRWRPAPPPTAPKSAMKWLRRPGSLTAALSRLGPVRVEVVQESLTAKTNSAMGSAEDRQREPVWTRDVLLLVEGVSVIAARSVTPAAHSRCAWRAVRSLGERPLATILYDDASVSRGRFSFASLNGSRIRRGDALSYTGCRLLARKSVFVRTTSPLLVTEVFLPELWRLVEESVC